MSNGAPVLHTLEVGDAGEPVVLLHSGGLSSRQWTRLARELGRTHRAVAPDFIGYGGSPAAPSDAAFSWRDDVTAVLALVDQLGGAAHLVGHSYGGLVALGAALERPAAALSLALVEPVAFGVLYDAGEAEALADLPQDPAFYDDPTGGDARWLTGFVDYWSGPGAFASLPGPARASWLAVGRKVFLEVRSLMNDRTPRAAYAAINSPTLLVSGALSRVAARRTCAILAGAMPRAEHVEIAGAGHMSPLTHAAEVNALVAAHVRAAPAP
ncbi:MAG TPA: alpha/beta hydrolase [Byssovorax sp.]|jgi:pimeloyl-ACP methyl ester carboxylesterase